MQKKQNKKPSVEVSKKKISKEDIKKIKDTRNKNFVEGKIIYK